MNVVPLMAIFNSPGKNRLSSLNTAIVVPLVDRDELLINQESVPRRDLLERLEAVFWAPFGDVARAIAIMRSAGVDKIGLISVSLRADREGRQFAATPLNSGESSRSC